MASASTAAIIVSATLFVAGACSACSAEAPATRRARADDGAPSAGSSVALGGPNAPAPVAPGPPAAATCAADAPGVIDTTALDPFFAAQMKAAGVPGVAVAVVGGGRIKWAKGYGLANIDENEPVTNDTLFMLASVSKTVTAVALMQLIEDPARGLTLDQDISAKLPFAVRNPRYPSVPITYRMLLTHTSSLIDSNNYWNIATPSPLHQGDSPIALVDFDRDYVARADSWSRSAPGTAFSYSNSAASVAGLLVEQISGMNLQDYSKAKIFDRLGMTESAWFLRDLDASHIAMPYDGTPLTPQGNYGYPDYPDGQLRTSAPQLARFLLMFAQKGQCGQRVLEETTVAAMRTVQAPAVDPSQGLIWYYATKSGISVLGHRGSDAGVSTDMFFDPATGAGYVLLSNGSTNTEGSIGAQDAMDAMNEKLLALASTLP